MRVHLDRPVTEGWAKAHASLRAPCPRVLMPRGREARGHGARQSNLRRLRKLVCVRAFAPPYNGSPTGDPIRIQGGTHEAAGRLLVAPAASSVIAARPPRRTSIRRSRSRSSCPTRRAAPPTSRRGCSASSCANPRPAIRGREQAGRVRHPRHRGDGALAARRLHADDRQRLDQRDHAGPVQEQVHHQFRQERGVGVAACDLSVVPDHHDQEFRREVGAPSWSPTPRKNPGKVKYTSAGIGSFPHFDMEIFARRAGVDMVHIPNKAGAAGMINDLVVGDARPPSSTRRARPR